MVISIYALIVAVACLIAVSSTYSSLKRDEKKIKELQSRAEYLESEVKEYKKQQKKNFEDLKRWTYQEVNDFINER